ncbi:hypothetical protein ACFL5V_12585 [Fibrobacterota bacterium]
MIQHRNKIFFSPYILVAFGIVFISFVSCGSDAAFKKTIKNDNLFNKKDTTIWDSCYNENVLTSLFSVDTLCYIHFKNEIYEKFFPLDISAPCQFAKDLNRKGNRTDIIFYPNLDSSYVLVAIGHKRGTICQEKYQAFLFNRTTARVGKRVIEKNHQCEYIEDKVYWVLTHP